MEYLVIDPKVLQNEHLHAKAAVVAPHYKILASAVMNRRLALSLWDPGWLARSGLLQPEFSDGPKCSEALSSMVFIVSTGQQNKLKF